MGNKKAHEPELAGFLDESWQVVRDWHLRPTDLKSARTLRNRKAVCEQPLTIGRFEVFDEFIGGTSLGLRKAAQLFLVIVGDEVIIGRGVNHQLDRRFNGQVLQLGEQRGDLVEELFVSHGGLPIGWAKNRIANAKVGYSDLL